MSRLHSSLSWRKRSSSYARTNVLRSPSATVRLRKVVLAAGERARASKVHTVAGRLRPALVLSAWKSSTVRSYALLSGSSER